MTFTAFDIMLPLGLGAIFGIFRYFDWRKTVPEVAAQHAAVDAIKGIAGMGVMTLILKYFGMI